MEDMSLDTEPSQVSGDSNRNMGLASGGQTYGRDHDATGVKEPTRLCTIELCRSEFCMFGEIVNRIDESTRSSTITRRTRSNICGPKEVSLMVRRSDVFSRLTAGVESRRDWLRCDVRVGLLLVRVTYKSVSMFTYLGEGRCVYRREKA